MSDDPDIEPASDDPTVQAFLDTRWRESMRAAREGMETLRELWPELAAHLPETAERAIKRALDDFEGAYEQLHRAGKYVIGQEGYDAYLEAQTTRSTGG